MTLFANSGVAWPNQERVTRDAGAKSLDAASAIFRALAAIESEAQPPFDSNLERSSELLIDASNTYLAVSRQLSNEYVERLSPSELELAVLPLQRRPYDDPLFELFLNTHRISMQQLYAELSQRAERLSVAVKSLNVKQTATVIAPQVFQIFALWESMTVLARVIAILGRRRFELSGVLRDA